MLSTNARVSSSEQIHLRLGRSLFFFPVLELLSQTCIPEKVIVLAQSGSLCILAAFAAVDIAIRGAPHFRSHAGSPILSAVFHIGLVPNRPRNAIPLALTVQNWLAHSVCRAPPKAPTAETQCQSSHS